MKPTDGFDFRLSLHGTADFEKALTTAPFAIGLFGRRKAKLDVPAQTACERKDNARLKELGLAPDTTASCYSWPASFYRDRNGEPLFKRYADPAHVDAAWIKEYFERVAHIDYDKNQGPYGFEAGDIFLPTGFTTSGHQAGHAGVVTGRGDEISQKWWNREIQAFKKTQSAYVIVSDADAIYTKAKALWPRPANDRFEVAAGITLPNDDENRADVFHRAHAFVWLNSLSALAEVERQMAGYKLFRSLTLVFPLDFPLAALGGVLDRSRAALVGLLPLLAVWRFLFLLDWTHWVTFESYALLTGSPARGPQGSEPRSRAG